MSKLTIGNRRVTTEQAIQWVSDYTSEPKDPNKPYGYPWYDTYDTGGSPLLVDGDLLAPVLLNVRPSIAAYKSLKSMTEQLNSILCEIPVNASLLELEELSVIGRLFAPLDNEEASYGVGGTTLAKVLHRKRPKLVPLYDERIWNCYCTTHPLSGATRRIPEEKGRSWVKFMTLMADAIRTDLTTEFASWWNVLDANSINPSITLLRCFDIVAWKCGETPTADTGPVDDRDESTQ